MGGFVIESLLGAGDLKKIEVFARSHVTRTLPTANRKVSLHPKNQNIDFVLSKTAILYPQ